MLSQVTSYFVGVKEKSIFQAVQQYRQRKTHADDALESAELVSCSFLPDHSCEAKPTCG